MHILNLSLAALAGAASASASDLHVNARVEPLLQRSVAETNADAKCEADLGLEDQRIAGAYAVTAGAFKRLPTREKVALVHAMADYWVRAALNEEAKPFAPTPTQRRLAVVLNERLAMVRRSADLGPFAEDLLLIATKLETLSTFAPSLPKKALADLKPFLLAVTVLPSADTIDNHARRAIVFAQISRLDLAPLEFKAPPAWEARAFHPDRAAGVTLDLVYNQAVTSALWHLDRSVEEDEPGLRRHRHVEYAAELLDVLAADLSRGGTSERASAQVAFAHVLRIIEAALDMLKDDGREADQPSAIRAVETLLRVRRHLKQDLLTRDAAALIEELIQRVNAQTSIH